MIGWHEMGRSDELAPRTVGQYWDFVSPRPGAAEHTLSFVEQGGKVILSPANAVYLDMKYDDATRLGLQWADGPTPVRDSYDWEPTAVVDGLAEADILGIEAPLWAETLRSSDDLEAMAFPRLLSAAELAWSPPTAAHGTSTECASPRSPPTWMRRASGSPAPTGSTGLSPLCGALGLLLLVERLPAADEDLGAAHPQHGVESGKNDSDHDHDPEHGDVQLVQVHELPGLLGRDEQTTRADEPPAGRLSAEALDLATLLLGEQRTRGIPPPRLRRRDLIQCTGGSSHHQEETRSGSGSLPLSASNSSRMSACSLSSSAAW